MEPLSKSMDLHSSTYENFIFLADFNAALTLKNLLLLVEKVLKSCLYWHDSYRSPKIFSELQND